MNKYNSYADRLSVFGQIVTDNVTVMLSYWDKDLTCRFANDAFGKWYGKQTDDVIDKVTLPELLGERYEVIAEYVKGVMRGEPQIFEREAVVAGKSKGFAIVNYIPHMVAGEVMGFISQSADVTQLMELELELKAKNKLVVEQNTRLLNFANIVSHNLKNHAINLATVLDFYNNATTEEEKEEMMGYLMGVSKGFSTTVDNLGEIVHAQNLGTKKPVMVNLHEYVEKSLEILRIELKTTKATIINNISPDTELRINPAYCESIILNLLSNTLKYRHPDRTPVVVLHTEEQNGYIVLNIADNGLGINMKKYGKDLFGMYKTFHGNADAHGIGLFITNFQVEAMGGHIEVTSTENVGSTFRVFFRKNPDSETVTNPLNNVVMGVE